MTTLETQSTIESSDMLSIGKELSALKKEISEEAKKEKQPDSQKSVEKKLIPMKEVVKQFDSHLNKISSAAEPYHVRLDRKSEVYLTVSSDAIFEHNIVKVIDIMKNTKKDKYSSRVSLFYDESTSSFYMSKEELEYGYRPGVYTPHRRKWEPIDAMHARKYLNRIGEYMEQAKEQRNEKWNEEVDKYASSTDADIDSIDGASLA